MTLHSLALAAHRLVRHGNIRWGDRVALLGRGSLFTQPADNRGRRLLVTAGATDSRISRVWRTLASRLDPSLVLDIGANYGEIGLSLRYRRDARIFLFEPNPTLTPYLRRSIAAHVNESQIELSTIFVGDRSGRQEFVVNRTWSGTSSAIGEIPGPRRLFREGEVEQFERIEVDSVTIDEMFSAAMLAGQRLLFKMDIEGYEAKALAGMSATLAQVSDFIGLVEIHPSRHRLPDTDPAAPLAWLTARGTVRKVRRYGLAPVDASADAGNFVVTSRAEFFRGRLDI